MVASALLDGLLNFGISEIVHDDFHHRRGTTAMTILWCPLWMFDWIGSLLGYVCESFLEKTDGFWFNVLFLSCQKGP